METKENTIFNNIKDAFHRRFIGWEIDDIQIKELKDIEKYEDAYRKEKQRKKWQSAIILPLIIFVNAQLIFEIIKTLTDDSHILIKLNFLFGYVVLLVIYDLMMYVIHQGNEYYNTDKASRMLDYRFMKEHDICSVRARNGHIAYITYRTMDGKKKRYKPHSYIVTFWGCDEVEKPELDLNGHWLYIPEPATLI